MANLVFKVDFHPWYDKGCWTDKFICYAYADKGQVIANVSVNEMKLIIHGEEKRAIQIGTVMTHPYYRGQGLIKKLMNHVLERYQDACDFIYLFANDTVLDFYPAFGFQSVQEYKYILDTATLPQHLPTGLHPYRKLDIHQANDFPLLQVFATDGISYAKTIDVRDNAHLRMFYFLIALPDCIYYLAKYDAIMLFQQSGNQLHLFAVISRKKQSLEAMISSIISPETKEIRFHFIPDLKNAELRVEKITGEDVLFVRPLVDFQTAYPLIPLTSHA